MTVHEMAPSGDLADSVDAYWWNDGSPAGGSTRILPDGCADIVFDPSGAFVVGTMTRPVEVDAAASAGAFGIRFRPGRAALALRMPLTEVTNAREQLRGWSELAERLHESRRIDVVEKAVRSALADARPDRRVDAAVETIILSGGRASIEHVAAAAGVSRQHLARSFSYHVGVSPKTFARVMRFRRALAMARRGRERWAGLAAELGYFDQSHLIAEFREFAGDTPVPFFLSRAE